jgi:hypothetical protein
MSHSRRGLLRAAVTFAAASALPAGAQYIRHDGTPPTPSNSSNFPDGTLTQVPSGQKPNSDPRAILKQNEQDIKKDIAHLTEVVAELQKSLDDIDTKEVLLLDAVHKTDEIEKLAKKIRSLLKNSGGR